MEYLARKLRKKKTPVVETERSPVKYIIVQVEENLVIDVPSVDEEKN